MYKFYRLFSSSTPTLHAQRFICKDDCVSPFTFIHYFQTLIFMYLHIGYFHKVEVPQILGSYVLSALLTQLSYF